jgi:hypothetical protein
MSDLNEVSFKLGQIDGKLDQVLEALKSHVADDAAKHSGSDERIAKLEKGRSWLMGVGAAVAFFFSAVWSFILEK